jgi:hypothetical protein
VLLVDIAMPAGLTLGAALLESLVAEGKQMFLDLKQI